MTAPSRSAPAAAGFSPPVENDKAKAATEVTAEMLKTVLPRSVPRTWVDRAYSIVTYGDIYSLMNFMASGATSDGSTILHWRPSPDVLDSTIQLPIIGFRESCRRINKVTGWGKLEGDLWEIKLRKIYNN